MQRAVAMQGSDEKTSGKDSVEDSERWPFGRALVVSLAFGCLFWGTIIYVLFFR